MGQRMRSWLARCLAILVTPVLMLGVMAGLTPAVAASAGSRESAGRPPAVAAALAAVPASLRAAIDTLPGTSVSAAGYSQQAELTVPDQAAGDEFGYSVALSAQGTTALVGAWYRNSKTGAAYVFTLRGGTWSQTAELTASDGAPGDVFGISVALSALGSTALIGAPGQSGAGAAYVFRLRGGSWSQAAELTASHEAPGDGIGWAVALSALGSTAVVGAFGYNSFAGEAYVFRLRGGTWSQTAELTAPDAAPFDAFGTAVALSAQGSTALIGAGARNSGAGAAYVFRLRGGTWSETAELTASHATSGDGFGTSVALSALGSTALIGAPGRNSAAGAAYVFGLRFGTWSQTAELTAPHATSGDGFGTSVALSALGSTALIGAPGQSGAGAAYALTLRGGTWSQTAELTAPHAARGDQFGFSAALSALGNTALVGAPFRNSNTGAAYALTGRGRA